MKTTLEKINGFDVLRVYGKHTWDQACALPAQVQGQHGIDDWVLPDQLTLKALAYLCEGIGSHWSSSPYSGGSDYVWRVDFGGGDVDDCYRLGSNQVRLVRASQCLDIGRAAQIKSMKYAGIEAQSAEK